MRLYSRSSIVMAGALGALAAVILTLSGVWAYLSLTEQTSVAARVESLSSSIPATSVALGNHP